MSIQRPSSEQAKEWLNKISIESSSNTSHLDDEIDLWDVKQEQPEETLRSLYAQYFKKIEFKPGDLVTWKTSMKNKTIPKTGQPAIVMEVLDEPLTDQEKESGSAYFQEKLDIVLGVLIDKEIPEKTLICWHYDSRRFTLWKP